MAKTESFLKGRCLLLPARGDSVIGPKSFTDEEKKLMQSEVDILEHRLYELEGSARDLCGRITKYSDEYADKLRGLLEEHGVDHLVEPCMKELFFCAESDDIRTRGVIGVSPVSEEAAKALCMCPEIPALEYEMERLGAEYHSRFDDFLEELTGLHQEYDRTFSFMVDYTMIESPFPQELKQDVIFYICDPARSSEVYRWKVNLITDDHSGPDETDLVRPFVLEERNVRRMEAEAEETGASVYVLHHMSRKVPVDRMAALAHAYLISKLVKQDSSALEARQAIQLERERAAISSFVSTLDSMLEEDEGPAAQQHTYGKPFFFTSPGEDVPDDVLERLMAAKPDGGYDC